MTIDVPHALRDSVVFLKDDAVHDGQIRSITVALDIEMPSPVIIYGIVMEADLRHYEPKRHAVKGSLVAKTREELIKQL